MTAYAQYTPVGLPRYNWNERHVAAAASLTPGDFYAQPDGLIGFYAGLESATVTVDQVVFYMTGVYDVLCAATTDLYSAGAAVYWDTVNKYAVTTASATCLFMGTAVNAKVTGSTRVTVALNSGIAPSLAGAATATTLTVGNITGTGTLALTGAATIGGTLAVTGATSSIGTISATNATTPIITTATGKTNTGYLQVLGKTSAGVRLTCADAMGYTLTLSAAAVATADRTLTFPDPGAADSVSYLGLAQAVTGAKTFTNAKVVVTSVTAVGSVASLATNSLAPGLNVIAGGGNSLGVMLPAASAGTVVEVVNASGSTALIYADGIGGTYAVCINALATSTGYSLATTKTTRLICENSTRWWTFPLAVA
jgi:hypothetical protein